jgi:ribosomal-protein-alanine N-acetyltransferase
VVSTEMIRIRKALAPDLPEIVAIEQSSFASPWNMAFFRHELYNPVAFFYIIEVGVKLAGYIIFWIFKDEAHIANLAIHPEYRKRGYGEYLFRWSLEFARNKKVATVTLEVNEKNLAARDLYEKFSFKIVGKREKYYENSDDALILTKVIA